MGASYIALTQGYTASVAPPHLVTIVPEWSPSDNFENFPYQDGALTFGWGFEWEALVARRANENPNYPGAPLNYIGMERFGGSAKARRPRLIIGPWTHASMPRTVSEVNYGPDSPIDLDGYILRWFDHFLKGVDNGADKGPPVYVFVMGENMWHAERDWPVPGAKPTPYYLVSDGHANSLEGNGTLTTTRPSQQRSDTYAYDPLHPTLDPYEADGTLDGPADTNISANSRDVLVYQTAPLNSPVEVVGRIEATLYAATSARDTDWMVRLVDVPPDGRAMLLTDGVLRARSRDPAAHGTFNCAQFSTIVPGMVYEYTIGFWRGAANFFQPGDRIRLEISSSWYPYFASNLNTGADNVATELAAEAVIAPQTIYHGPRYPSHILLPIVSTDVIAQTRK